MTKTIVQTELLAISILAKGHHRNSVLLGSKHKISIKLGVSYHILRKCFTYGLQNNLITKTNDGFIVPSYKKLIEMFGYELKHARKFVIRKEGTFKELYHSNLFSIAEMNFKQQKYKSKFNEKILNIQKVARTEYGSLSKSEYKLYQIYRNTRVWLNKNIITGQFHLSNILNLSASYCNRLMKIWVQMKLMKRKLVYSNEFDPSQDSHRVLSLKKGMFICKGSLITLYN